jgi:hypothetical protein
MSALITTISASPQATSPRAAVPAEELHRIANDLMNGGRLDEAERSLTHILLAASHQVAQEGRCNTNSFTGLSDGARRES